MINSKMKYLLVATVLFFHRGTDGSHSHPHRPMDLMADLTNDLGVCILQAQSTIQHGNVAFSPYGLASMTVLLFEGATGNTALEIMRVMNLPWNTLLTRVGFRDINRHLKTYFKSDGFLRGLIMSRDDVCFHHSYQKLLRLYGFEEPDQALTYPCSGFVPYSPPMSTLSSSTVEAATVTSPSSGNETSTSEPTTTIVSREGDDNVVTELTQTSQTVLVLNSTTFKPIDAETANGAQISTTLSKNTNIFDKSDAATELRPRMTTRPLVTNDDMNVSPSDITAEFSYTMQDTSMADKITNKASSLTMEMAASTVKQQKLAETPKRRDTIEPKTGATATTKSVPSTSFSNFTYTTINATSKPSTLDDKKTSNGSVGSQNKPIPPVNVTQNYHSRKNNTTFSVNDGTDKFHDYLGKKNFTLKFSTTDFTFPLANTESSIEKLFHNQSHDVVFGTTDDISFDRDSNFSILEDWNTSTYFKTPLFNDSTLVSITTPSELEYSKLDFNNSSTLYNTLVNFIENTTQKIKNFVTFDKPSTTTESTPTITDPSLPFTPLPAPKNTILSPANSSKANITTAMPPTVQNETSSNISSNPTLFLDDKTIADKTNTSSDSHNLPKKSITTNNEKSVASAVSLVPGHLNQRSTLYEYNKPSNYLNVLSLKRSKSISSKYDIKGVRRANKSLVKRATSASTGGKQAAANPKDHNLAQRQNQRNLTKNTMKNTSSGNATRASQTNPLRRTITENGITSAKEKDDHFLSTLSLPLADGYEAYLPALLSTAENYGSDYRKIRSYNHKHFTPFNMDWFSTSSQNTVRTPIFTYSAILPFAHIEDLKAKALEIPLDDQNYSLLLLLPTPGFGINYVINSLTNWPLRKIYDYLRKTPVFAAIPKFSIVSHVNLRSALYSLGIRDVFHRYRADLSVMSPDARLFVKSIEQVVTIHVDKFQNTAYPIPEKYAERHFMASHPFLYFVIDKETGVSLVTGIMADPTRQMIKFI